MVILEARQLSKSFGGLQAVKDFSIKLHEREILGLIGPNGAGKTTCFNLLAGALSPTNGEVMLAGKDITRLRPDQRCSLGLARTFQITKPFPNMTLVENVMVGARYGSKKLPLKKAREKSYQVLEMMGMSDIADKPAKDLSIGNRKKLEMSRALAAEPKVLLLDEVAGGLNPSEVSEIMKIILQIRESGVSIIMIEHVMKAVMGISDRIVVINQGKQIAEGTPKEITENPLVIEAYLGRRDAHAEV